MGMLCFDNKMAIDVTIMEHYKQMCRGRGTPLWRYKGNQQRMCHSNGSLFHYKNIPRLKHGSIFVTESKKWAYIWREIHWRMQDSMLLGCYGVLNDEIWLKKWPKTGWFDCFCLRPTGCVHSLRTPPPPRYAGEIPKNGHSFLPCND